MADDIVYINVNEGLNRVMKNTTLYTKLLKKFINEDHFGGVDSAFTENDAEKAKNAVHTLKGLAANLSMTELYKQLVELEAQLKAGNVDTARLDEVKKIFALTITEADKVVKSYA